MEDTPAPSPAKESMSTPTESAETSREHEEELGEKMKKIEMKQLGPPAARPVGRVRQLRDAALKPSGSLTSGSATGNPRNKTALAPGHSLMDWIRLGSSGVDLTGVGGRLLTVTPAELARHGKEDDAWIAIRGIVFNITRYLAFHPGGIPELMKGAGKDATKLFDDVHSWVNYQSILQKCVVGRLERSVSAELLFASDSDKPKKAAVGGATRAASARLDWRQTSVSISLFLEPGDGPLGECQLHRLGDAEFALRVALEKPGRVASYSLKLAGDVDWPASCRRSSESQEVEIVFRKQNRGIWKSYGTHSESQEEKEESNSPARTYNEYELLENTPLCKVVHLLVLRARNYIQLVPPGRHVQVKMNVMGTEVSRAYTPVPSCLHPEDRPPAAAGDDCLCLMVKRCEGGALSPALVALRPGEMIQLSDALGGFRPEPYDDSTAMHLLAAGSGLTVMLPIVKRALARRSPPAINLINFNKDEDNVFYARELERVSGERTLKMTQVLSAAGPEWPGRRGLPSEELLRDLMVEPAAKACVFVCGPSGFQQLARTSLESLGWEAERLYVFDG